MKNKKAETIDKSRDPQVWVDLYGDYLYGYAYSRLKDHAAAEDAVQETFLSAIKSIENFKGLSSIKTWLTGILRHKIIDHFRKSARENSLPLESPSGESIENHFTGKGKWALKPDRWDTDPHKILEQKDFMTVALKCVAGLSERLAKAFTLRELEGASTEEICKVLNISTTNCWVMLHRARSLMRRCMEIKWLDRPA